MQDEEEAKTDNGNTCATEAAQERVDEAAKNLQQAKQALNEALQVQAKLKGIMEELQAWKEAHDSLAEEMRERHRGLEVTQETVQRAKEIMAHKYEAMEKYLNSPGVREAERWLFSPSVPKSVLNPQQLSARLNPPSEVRMEIARYLRDSNPGFGRIIDNLAERMHHASTPQERWSAMHQVRATGTGNLAELIVQRGMECYGGKTETQTRAYVDGGRYTKTDLVVKDLKQPVILGKGKGMMAPQGGSIAIEIKCGCKEYLMQQASHMEFQAKGHQHYDASFTLTTRDIVHLPPEKQQQLRDTLRNAKSPIIGMLPEKAQMDETCMKLIEERMEDLYGKDSNQTG